jgi:uncharacterized cysteine cluster protein YcgN (CxxCxxCC family)
MTRTCGTCTKCCEGHLTAQIFDQQLKKGVACKFIDREKSRCGIYHSERPFICSDFKCAWLRNEKEFLPEWMRPDISNQIVLFHRLPECEWFEIAEAGEQMSVVMLTWFIGEAKRKNLNIKYTLDGQVFFVGSDIFKKLAG